jgi:hypothetical protein
MAARLDLRRAGLSRRQRAVLALAAQAMTTTTNIPGSLDRYVPVDSLEDAYGRPRPVPRPSEEDLLPDPRGVVLSQMSYVRDVDTGPLRRQIEVALRSHVRVGSADWNAAMQSLDTAFSPAHFNAMVKAMAQGHTLVTVRAGMQTIAIHIDAEFFGGREVLPESGTTEHGTVFRAQRTARQVLAQSDATAHESGAEVASLGAGPVQVGGPGLAVTREGAVSELTASTRGDRDETSLFVEFPTGFYEVGIDFGVSLRVSYRNRAVGVTFLPKGQPGRARILAPQNSIAGERELRATSGWSYQSFVGPLTGYGVQDYADLLLQASDTGHLDPRSPSAALTQALRSVAERADRDGTTWSIDPATGARSQVDAPLQVVVDQHSATQAPDALIQLQHVARNLGRDIFIDVEQPGGGAPELFLALPDGSLISRVPGDGFGSARGMLEQRYVDRAHRLQDTLRASLRTIYEQYRAAAPEHTFAAELRRRLDAAGAGPAPAAFGRSEAVPGTRHHGAAEPGAGDRVEAEVRRRLAGAASLAVEGHVNQLSPVEEHGGVFTISIQRPDRQLICRVSVGEVLPGDNGELPMAQRSVEPKRDKDGFPDFAFGRPVFAVDIVVSESGAPDQVLDALVHDLTESLSYTDRVLSRQPGTVDAGQPSPSDHDAARAAQLTVQARRLVDLLDGVTPMQIDAALDRRSATGREVVQIVRAAWIAAAIVHEAGGANPHSPGWAAMVDSVRSPREREVLEQVRSLVTDPNGPDAIEQWWRRAAVVVAVSGVRHLLANPASTPEQATQAAQAESEAINAVLRELEPEDRADAFAVEPPDVSLAQPFVPSSTGPAISLLSTDVAEILRLAAALRTPTGQVDAEGLHALLEHLPVATVPDDGGGRGLRNTLLWFAHGHAPPAGTIITQNQEGTSAAAVFMVGEAGSPPTKVVKVFADVDRMAQELSAAARLAAPDVAGVRVPVPRAVFLVDSGGRRLGAIVSDYLGATLRDLLTAAQGSDRAMAALYDAVRSTGLAYRTLHDAASDVARPATAYVTSQAARLRAQAEQVLAHPAWYGLPPDVEAVRQRLNEVIAAALANPGPSSLVHGDASPGNVTVDPAGQVGLIDLWRLHMALDKSGRPTGAAAKDAAFSEERLVTEALAARWNAEAIAQLLATFGEGYGRGPDEARTMFRVLYLLSEMLSEAQAGHPGAPQRIADLAVRFMTALGVDTRSPRPADNAVATPGTHVFGFDAAVHAPYLGVDIPAGARVVVTSPGNDVEFRDVVKVVDWSTVDRGPVPSAAQGIPSMVDLASGRHTQDEVEYLTRAATEGRYTVKGSPAAPGPFTVRLETGRYAITSGDGVWKAEYEIFDANGAKIGASTEKLINYASGPCAVHVRLQLNANAQSMGFAEHWNENLYQWYWRSRISRVTTVSWGVGGYVWATQGFDFESATEATGYLQNQALPKINTELRLFREPAGVTRADLLDLRTYVEDMLAGKIPARAPALAQFGRKPGQSGKTAIWAGKWLMLGSHWSGIREPTVGDLLAAAGHHDPGARAAMHDVVAWVGQLLGRRVAVGTGSALEYVDGRADELRALVQGIAAHSRASQDIGLDIDQFVARVEEVIRFARAAPGPATPMNGQATPNRVTYNPVTGDVQLNADAGIGSAVHDAATFLEHLHDPAALGARDPGPGLTAQQRAELAEMVGRVFVDVSGLGAAMTMFRTLELARPLADTLRSADPAVRARARALTVRLNNALGIGGGPAGPAPGAVGGSVVATPRARSGEPGPVDETVPVLVRVLAASESDSGVLGPWVPRMVPGVRLEDDEGEYVELQAVYRDQEPFTVQVRVGELGGATAADPAGAGSKPAAEWAFDEGRQILRVTLDPRHVEPLTFLRNALTVFAVWRTGLPSSWLAAGRTATDAGVLAELFELQREYEFQWWWALSGDPAVARQAERRMGELDVEIDRRLAAHGYTGPDAQRRWRLVEDLLGPSNSSSAWQILRALHVRAGVADPNEWAVRGYVAVTPGTRSAMPGQADLDVLGQVQQAWVHDNVAPKSWVPRIRRGALGTDPDDGTAYVEFVADYGDMPFRVQVRVGVLPGTAAADPAGAGPRATAQWAFGVERILRVRLDPGHAQPLTSLRNALTVFAVSRFGLPPSWLEAGRTANDAGMLAELFDLHDRLEDHRQYAWSQAESAAQEPDEQARAQLSGATWAVDQMGAYVDEIDRRLEAAGLVGPAGEPLWQLAGDLLGSDPPHGARQTYHALRVRAFALSRFGLPASLNAARSEAHDAVARLFNLRREYEQLRAQALSAQAMQRMAELNNEIHGWLDAVWYPAPDAQRLWRLVEDSLGPDAPPSARQILQFLHRRAGFRAALNQPDPNDSTHPPADDSPFETDELDPDPDWSRFAAAVWRVAAARLGWTDLDDEALAMVGGLAYHDRVLLERVPVLIRTGPAYWLKDTQLPLGWRHEVVAEVVTAVRDLNGRALPTRDDVVAIESAIRVSMQGIGPSRRPGIGSLPRLMTAQLPSLQSAIDSVLPPAGAPLPDVVVAQQLAWMLDGRYEGAGDLPVEARVLGATTQAPGVVRVTLHVCAREECVVVQRWLVRAPDGTVHLQQPRLDRDPDPHDLAGPIGGEIRGLLAQLTGPRPVTQQQGTRLDALPRLAQVLGPEQEAALVNPRYGSTADRGSATYRRAGMTGGRWTREMGPPPRGAYEKNSTNAAIALELRIRGFDVEGAAADGLDRLGRAVDRTRAQLNTLLRNGLRRPNGLPPERSLVGQERSFTEVRAQITRDWPTGARGLIVIAPSLRVRAEVLADAFDGPTERYRDERRLVLNVMKEPEKIRYIEARKLGVLTPELLERYGKYQASVMRLDDLVPTDDILQAVVAGRPVVTIDALPRSARIGSAGAEARLANPRYGVTRLPSSPEYREAGEAGERWTRAMGRPPHGAYESNSTNAIIAWVLRMDGYDVEAAPSDLLEPYGEARDRTDDEMDRLLRAGFSLPGGEPHGRSLAGLQWRPHAEIDAEIVSEWDDGARGFIRIGFSGRGTYTHNVVKKNGNAYYIPPFDTSVETLDLTAFERKYGRMSEMKVVRLDDLVPTDGVLQAVQVVW